MSFPSQKYTFDNRLLAIEELIRQRKNPEAQKEFSQLQENQFQSTEHELGLFQLLQAECHFIDGNFRRTVETGLKAARILAGFPLNRRFGRIQLVLSKAYAQLGDLKNAEIRARDALASYRRANDNSGQVDSLNELARIAFYRCNYSQAIDYIDEAIEKNIENPRKVAQLTGNAGRIRILLGKWTEAQENLETALKYNVEHNEEISQAVNLLSLGFLHFKLRDFSKATKEYNKALVIIDKLDLKWEKGIYLEYMGELALEKGDTYRAKNYLYESYQLGQMLAPQSTLATQTGRLLAEVELSLEYIDEAMKYAQKALELSLQIGEKAEVGMSQRAIARVFAMKKEYTDALEYINQSVEVLREVGDPYEYARTLLVQADIKLEAETGDDSKIQAIYDEARRIFRKLQLDFWLAETDFKAGFYSCREGDLYRGFKKLSRAEKTFTGLSERGKVKAVNQFLQSLTDQAVALSISEENEFKIFGNLITRAELKELKTGEMDEILHVLINRTGSNRAIIFYPDFDSDPVISSMEMSPAQAKRFADSFQQMLGEEIASDRPSLMLDCRRDPFIKNLFPDDPELIASVIVVPIRMSNNSSCYLYLDKLSNNNMLNPFRQEELNFAVGFSDILIFKAAEMQKQKLIEDNRRLKTQLREQAAFPNIITRNRSMLDVLAQVQQVVDANISIAIEGETGSGKDILARAIHYNSNRREKRFISVNCAALPETLLESELFGYKRGAFTGADADKPGLFEEANGGTFFLDEIADMPLSIQAKILRVIEQKEIVRLGETTPRQVDVRIVSATNKNLKEEMKKGTFRQDLYYRLTAMIFRLPPLRERKDDIPLLVEHFLADSGKELSSEVMKYLVAYDWPGNIRELENEIRKMILLSGNTQVIEPPVLASKITSTFSPDNNGNGNGNGNLQKALEDVEFHENYTLYDYLATFERKFIIRALREHEGVKKHAAASLNIPESTLRLKIKQYKIDVNDLDNLN